MRVSLVSPDASFYDGEAEMVILPAWDGEMGVLPRHAPMIARLGYGVIRIHDATGEHPFAVYGGFAKVQDDVVTVLAGGADTAPGDLDAAREAWEGAVKELRELKDSGADIPADLAAIEERVKRAHAYYILLRDHPLPGPLT